MKLKFRKSEQCENTVIKGTLPYFYFKSKLYYIHNSFYFLAVLFFYYLLTIQYSDDTMNTIITMTNAILI